jgi:hypothetical protein
MSDADDFLFSGGVPSAKFPAIGAVVTGIIDAKPEVQQQRDYESGDPMVWDDGKPRQQIRVVLATGERSDEYDDDDGLRALYIKGGLLKGVRAAVKKAGAKGLEIGGRLTVTYVSDGETVIGKSGKPLNPPKNYAVDYQPAGEAAVQGVLADEPTEQPAVNAAQAVAVPAPRQEIDLSQFTPEQIAAALRAAQS